MSAPTSLGPFPHVVLLSRGDRSLVFRAQRPGARPVLLKAPCEAEPSRETIARFEREFRVGQALDLRRVVRYLDRLIIDERPVLVLEDTGGLSLDRHTEQRDLAETVALAAEIARALADLHACEMVHKEVSPSNIVWNRRSRVVQLIDLHHASTRARERPEFRRASATVGMLRTLAPERFGRTNRLVDARTDLYSLGATLYELLTGRPPFDETDPEALLEAHLAQRPVPVHVLVPSIPVALSQIVDRLLEKEPDHRYQSANGLLPDLERVFEAIRAGIEPRFELGADDVPSRVRIGQRLIGRERQTGELLEAVDRVIAGSGETVVLVGASGAGKTVLARELCRPLALRGGILLEGGCATLVTAAPYAAFRQALSGLVPRLSGGEVERCQALLRDAPGGALLLALVPELEPLLGAQTPFESGAPLERERGLHQALRGLLAAVATAERPLVLFIDDLQAGDPSSVKLFDVLAYGEEIRHCLLLAAWSGDDAPARWSEVQERRLTCIPVNPLSRDDVWNLMVTTLRAVPQREALRAPAEAVFARTGGNPLFVKRVLEELGDRGGLRFDAENRSWKWTLAPVRSPPPTEGVVAFLLARIHALPDGPRRALQRAACIGTEFDLRQVSEILQGRGTFIQYDLELCMEREWVEPDGLGWPMKADATLDWAPDEAYRYRFSHDCAQAAAALSMPAEEAAQVHRDLAGVVLLANTDVPLGLWIFRLVHHLGRAVSVLDVQERLELAELCLRASRVARDSCALETAAAVAEAGIAYLPPEAWRLLPLRVGPLFLETAELSYLLGNVARMADLVTVVRRQLGPRSARVMADLPQALDPVVQAAVGGARAFE